MFNVKNSLAPEIMTEVFEIKEPHYNFRSDASHFKRETSSLLIMVFNQIWNTVPQNIRESNSLNEFKNLIKLWKADTCPCRLCKN